MSRAGTNAPRKRYLEHCSTILCGEPFSMCIWVIYSWAHKSYCSIEVLVTLTRLFKWNVVWYRLHDYIVLTIIRIAYIIIITVNAQ